MSFDRMAARYYWQKLDRLQSSFGKGLCMFWNWLFSLQSHQLYLTPKNNFGKVTYMKYESFGSLLLCHCWHGSGPQCPIAFLTSLFPAKEHRFPAVLHSQKPFLLAQHKVSGNNSYLTLNNKFLSMTGDLLMQRYLSACSFLQLRLVELL